MSPVHSMQFLGLAALAIGAALTPLLKHAPMRGWVAVLLLLVTAIAWANNEPGPISHPARLPMFLTFLFLAPLAIDYSFRARRLAPDRTMAMAAFAGAFIVVPLLLYMLGEIAYSLIVA